MQRTASYTRNIQGASFCGEKSKPGSPGICYNQSEHRFTNQSTGREKMPRTEESNQRIREEQTHKIMVAATKVFARKGLAATKMADIAAEAGISYGLLYNYFASY